MIKACELGSAQIHRTSNRNESLLEHIEPIKKQEGPSLFSKPRLFSPQKNLSYCRLSFQRRAKGGDLQQSVAATNHTLLKGKYYSKTPKTKIRSDVLLFWLLITILLDLYFYYNVSILYYYYS